MFAGRSVILGIAVGLAFAASARAGANLLVGFDDDSIEWATNTVQVTAVERSLGAGAVRVTLDWSPSEDAVSDPQDRLYLRRLAQAERLGERVVLEVYGPAGSPPATAADRADYCSFTANALERTPGVDDVVIWNEANNPHFWARPDANAYEALLATCWDVLHARFATVNVISSTAPHQHPGAFIAALGAAYRASGRSRPIFDTFGHNAYPETDAESPAKVHGARSHSLDEGDYVRLLASLQAAFGGTDQPVPGDGAVTIWYLEDGFQTAVDPGLLDFYVGSEGDRHVLPAAEQAARLTEAIELASCQPAVGAFFNFQLADDRSLGGWQSGVLWANWTPKPAFAAVQQAIAAVASGRVDCAQFGSAA